MKKIISALVFSLALSFGYGQLYVQPTLGYTFSRNPIKLQSVLIAKGEKSVYETKVKPGEGAHFGFGVGYGFKNNLFVELTGQKSIYTVHWTSTPRPDLKQYKRSDYFWTSGNFGQTRYQSNLIQFSPLVGYKIQRKGFSCYVKAGPNFLRSTLGAEERYDAWEYVGDAEPENLYRRQVEFSSELSGKFHVGLQSNLGFSFNVKEHLEIVLELVSVTNNYKITKGEILSLKVDGESQLDGSKDQRNCKLIKMINRLDHSYFGMNVGVKYVFERKR